MFENQNQIQSPLLPPSKQNPEDQPNFSENTKEKQPIPINNQDQNNPDYLEKDIIYTDAPDYTSAEKALYFEHKKKLLKE